MYRFDSRFLRQFDSVTRQFSDPGEYFYHMAVHAELTNPPAAKALAQIEVDDTPSSKPRQHRINVRYSSSSHSFIPYPRRLAINKGDTIQWHMPKEHTHGYFVKVIDHEGNPVFNSQALNNNTVFTHFFTHPGQYHYRNSLSDSAQRPVINVYQVDARKEDWKKLSTTPTLIRFQNGAFTPDKVDVPEGGTVIWLIEGCEPVAIQLTCYDLVDIDFTKVPRPPRGTRGCKPKKPKDDCKK